MPRTLVFASALAIAVLGLLLAAGFGSSGAHAAGQYTIDVQVSDDIYSVKCDGVDSFRVTATVTLDGVPVAGAQMTLRAADGRSFAGTTNAHGVFRMNFAPKPSDDGGGRSYFFLVGQDGETTFAMSFPRFFSCPFPIGPYGLALSVFRDANGNGVQERREHALRNASLLIGFNGGTLQGTLFARSYPLDHDGSMTASLPLGGDGARSRWAACLSPQDVQRGLHVVSTTGPGAEIVGDCVYLAALVVGDERFSIGVR